MAEKFTMMLLAASTVAALNVTAQSIAACSYPPCHLVPVETVYYYPDWDDCERFWVCENKRSRSETCPSGQVWDLATFQCRPRPVYIDYLHFLRSPVFSCHFLLRGIGASAQG